MEKTISNRSNKNIYISVMNVIAAFSVVILHANVSFWLDRATPFWSTANVIESVFYFAVPVFFTQPIPKIAPIHQGIHNRSIHIKYRTLDFHKPS